MTTDDAGDIIGVTPNSAGRFYRAGLIRGQVKAVDGQTMLILNGRDVQWLKGLRDKYGVALGMAKARVLAVARYAKRGGR